MSERSRTGKTDAVPIVQWGRVDRFTMGRDVDKISKAGMASSVTYLDLAFGDILGLMSGLASILRIPRCWT